MQESGIVTGLEVRGIMVWFPAVTIDGPTQPRIQCETRLFSWGGLKRNNVNVKEVKNE